MNTTTQTTTTKTVYNPITKRHVIDNKRNRDSIAKQVAKYETKNEITHDKPVIVEEPCKYSTVKDVMDDLLLFNWYPSLLLNVKANRLRARTSIAWRFQRVKVCLLDLQSKIGTNTSTNDLHIDLDFEYKKLDRVLKDHTRYMAKMKADLLTTPEIDEINAMHNSLKAMLGKLSKQFK